MMVARFGRWATPSADRTEPAAVGGTSSHKRGGSDDEETLAPSSGDEGLVDETSSLYSSTTLRRRPWVEGESLLQADKSQPCWLVRSGDQVDIVQHPQGCKLYLQPSALAQATRGQPQEELCQKRVQEIADQSLVSQLACVQCTASSAKVQWMLDARKLYSKDKVVVSPAFELLHGCSIPFRILVKSRVKTQKRGGESFVKSRGVGSILLKCEAPVDQILAMPSLEVKITVGDQPGRSFVHHDFGSESVAGLQPHTQYWNLRSAVDASSQSVAVCLEMESRASKQ